MRWAKLPDNPRDAELWRHPEIGTIPKDRLETVAFEMMEHYWGMQYSYYSRLVPLARGPRILKPFYWVYAKVRDIWERSQVPGPFCSELVAQFYQRLPLELFVHSREPCKVSPNHFPNSKLQKVSDAIVRRADLANFVVSKPNDHGHSESIVKILDGLGQNMCDQRIATKKFDELVEQGEEIRQYICDYIEQSVSARFEFERQQIGKLLDTAKPVATPTLVRWISQLVSNFRFVTVEWTSFRKNRPDDTRHALWVRASFKFIVSRVRLSAIVKSRRLKMIQRSERESKPWFWKVRACRINRARKQFLKRARAFTLEHASKRQSAHHGAD